MTREPHTQNTAIPLPAKCLLCGKPLRADRTHCSECRAKPTACLKCGNPFRPKTRGKFPDNCQMCTLEIKRENGREFSAKRSVEKRKAILNCKKCGEPLPFGKTTKFQYCRDCYPVMKQEYDRERRIKNVEKDPHFDKRRDLKKHYGISLEDYDRLFLGQGKKCAICKSARANGKGWHVDHDHETGRIRGILCHFCNLGIGHFKDDVASIDRAISYLSFWEEIHG